jgi:hypothetical protein
VTPVRWAERCLAAGASRSSERDVDGAAHRHPSRFRSYSKKVEAIAVEIESVQRIVQRQYRQEIRNLCASTFVAAVKHRIIVALIDVLIMQGSSGRDDRVQATAGAQAGPA